MKVVVGQNTIVKKITVGTPLRVGSAANGSLTGLDDVNGSINLSDGTILQYDSATGKFNHVTPAGITGSGLTVNDASGLGSVVYDSSSAVLTYAGPSSDSVHSLFNSTYDSNSLGTLSYTNGTVRLVGPTSAQIRALFSAGNSLNYNETTGEFSVTVPDTSASFDSDFGTKTTDDLAEGSNLYFTDSRGRAAIGVTDNGVGFGSLAYNSASGQITYTGTSVANMRSVINVGSNLAYDSTTGKITFTGSLGGDFDAGDAQQSISVVNDNGDYGSLAYDNASGVFTFTKVTDSDIRGSISAGGDLVYDQTTGQISYSKRTDADIRSLFSAGGDLTYNNTTGNFSITTGAHYADSDARAAFSVNFVGDTAFDSSPYGGASYNASTGLLTINGTTDSNIRNSLTVQDSGGLGSLTYNVKQGRIVYTGPGVSDVSSLLSANVDSLSMGKLTLDSSKGQFTLKLEDDSVRALFSVVSDQEGGANLTYDQATGVFTHSGPSDLDLRGKVSASDLGGDGSFTYFESGGVFTYTGPSPAEARAHFEGGLGIDYIESTGTFRLDSSANIITGSIVTGKLTVTDSATISRARIESRLNIDTIRSLTDSGDIDIIAGDDVEITAGDKINLLTSNLRTSADKLRLLSDDSNINNISGGGLILGAGSNEKSILHQQYFGYDQFVIGANTGLHVPGFMTGRTVDSINKRIDELPDSAQMKGILSAGPGLSYDNINGIYRITSSGVVAGTYGDATNVPRFSVDSLGQIDSISNVPISTVNNFVYDSATGNLKITTATDSYNVGITLDPFTTNNLVEGPNNLYYTRARFDSALDDSTSETRIRQYFRTDLASDSSRQQIRKYINVGASLTYDSATGKLTTNQALDSNSDVRFQNITQSGQLRGPAEFIIDPAAIGDNTGTVKILGNLQVEGTQTIINSTTVSVNDKNLVLGDSAADSSALHGAGITLGGTNIVDKPSFTYSHADTRFVFNRNIQADSFYGDVTGNLTGNVTGNVTGQVSDISNHTTTDLAEGDNKYFTIARARNTIQATDAGGDGSFIYDSSTGTMTYTGPSPAETRQHLAGIDAGGDGSFGYDSSTGKFTYTGPSPTEVRSHFSVTDAGGDGSFSYDSATGTFTYVGASEADFYQHLKNNHDSLGDLTFDSTYGTKGGFALHTRHIMRQREVYADSFINSQEYFLMYSGTTGGTLVKVRADTLASKMGGGGGGAGGGLLGYINL